MSLYATLLSLIEYHNIQVRGEIDHFTKYVLLQLHLLTEKSF